MKRLFSGVLFAITVAILILAYIWSPSDNSLNYWISVIWLLALLLINTGITASFFNGVANRQSSSSISIKPAAILLFGTLSVLSIVILLLFNFGLISTNVHISFQVLLGLSAVVTFALGYLVKFFAGNGIETNVTRAMIIDACQSIKLSGLGGGDVDALIEYVEHRMPHPSKLNDMAVSSAYAILRSEDGEMSERISKAMNHLRSVR